MNQPRNFCLFCNGIGMSKEHLMSDWLKEFFPRTATATHTIGTTTDWRVGRPKYDRQHRPGHAGTFKRRRVCVTCNNGWISEVDEAAKAAVPLILGQKCVVSEDIQERISTWAVKMAMVADNANPNGSVVPARERVFLMDARRPPSGWGVWAAPYDGAEWAEQGMSNNGCRVHAKNHRGSFVELGFVGSTLFGLKHLLLFVTGSDISGVDFYSVHQELRMHRLWPSRHSFEWSTSGMLGDKDAERIIGYLRDKLSNAIDLPKSDPQ